MAAPQCRLQLPHQLAEAGVAKHADMLDSLQRSGCTHGESWFVAAAKAVRGQPRQQASLPNLQTAHPACKTEPCPPWRATSAPRTAGRQAGTPPAGQAHSRRGLAGGGASGGRRQAAGGRRQAQRLTFNAPQTFSLPPSSCWISPWAAMARRLSTGVQSVAESGLRGSCAAHKARAQAAAAADAAGNRRQAFGALESKGDGRCLAGRPLAGAARRAGLGARPLSEHPSPQLGAGSRCLEPLVRGYSAA